MRRAWLLLVMVVIVFLDVKAGVQDIVINEFLAKNVDVLPGELWEFGDWAELYNAGDSPVDIGGMYFSDDEVDPWKWQIPADKPKATTIPAHGYLILWFDHNTHLGPTHLDFALNGDGEQIIIHDSDKKTLIDKITYKEQYPDISYGRLRDGSEIWTYFEKPTPGKPNEGLKAPISERGSRPDFSPGSGFFDEPVTVKLKASRGTTIYYTTDGSEPQVGEAAVYEAPITIEETSVVRAKAVKEGFISSAVTSHTYFVDEPTNLPVVSLIADPERLWEKRTGLYTSYFSDLERGGYVEFFDIDRSKDFSGPVGIKLSGQYSKEFAKKPFGLMCRSKYGMDRIHYPLFADKPDIKSFDGLILRSDPTNSKNFNSDITGERIKNELIYQLNKELGGHVDMQAYLPAVLFINGQYWGLYNIMERKDDDFIKNNHGTKKIDMINGKDLEVIAGDTEDYQALLDFLNEHNIRQDSVYAAVKEKIDVKSFIDYWILETYYASNDGAYNIRFWKPKEGGKWHWVTFDQDSWNTYQDTTLHVFTQDTVVENIYLLGRLVQNREFRDAFINRFADALNTVMLPENIHRLIDEITAVIASEKMRDRERWEGEMKFVPVNSQINKVKKFAEYRPTYLRREMVELFDLDGMTEVTININDPDKGYVQLNTIKVKDQSWLGVYFQGVPITVTAVPKEGYRFAGWSDASLPNKPTVEINLVGATYSLTADFE